jgi:3-oxoacyl-[acyl-carrier-protein] synthase II
MGRVFVSGVGVVSPVGFGRDDFRSALLEGRSAAREVERFDTSGMDRSVACEVKGFRPRDFMSAAEVKRTGRCAQFALAATRMALEDAGLRPDELEGPRTSVIMGTTMGEANVLGELEAAWIHDGEAAIIASKIPRYGTTLLPIHVARAIGARGMVHTLPAACAAGNYAIGFAADMIREGRADVVVTGASEVMEKVQYAGFVRLGAMAPDRVRPFDRDRKGLLLGEGSGVMILESEAHLVRRGGVPLAEVGGAGFACDAHHITRPDPGGTGFAQAMNAAIHKSGLRAEDIDLINAHGTATHANDLIEARVIREIFGDHRVPVTSIKSMLGHCMGAASAIEAVSCILSIEDQMHPPTIHFDALDPECDVDIVANRAQQAKADVVLNNALAFGGYDAVVIFAKPGVLPATSMEEAA